MKRQLLVEVVCGLLILLFLYASISKVVDMKAFKNAMYNQPFPNWMAAILMWAVPITEILIAAALLWNRTVLFGLRASLVLMSSFTLYTGAILLHLFSRVPCSCGGVISKLKWPQHLIFNLFFVGIAIAGIVMKRNRQPIASKQIVYT